MDLREDTPAPTYIESIGSAASSIGVSQMFEQACVTLGIVPMIFINRIPHYREDAACRVIIWLKETGRVRTSHATAFDMHVYPSGDSLPDEEN